MKRAICLLAFLFAFPSLSIATVKWNGIFQASRSCPAYRSIRRRSNPGRLFVHPGNRYRVVGKNKASATYYLILIGERSSRRWVAVSCGALTSGEPSRRAHKEASRPEAMPKTVPSSSLSARGNRKFTYKFARRNILYKHIYREQKHQKTIYCNCSYSGRRADLTTCGTTLGRRGASVNVEHVVPASVLGRTSSYWRKGPGCRKKRSCARKYDRQFAYMEGDLYNLYPSLKYINSVRSNLPLGEVAGEPRMYGQCDFESDGRVAEPRAAIRGDLARVYFYMAWAYPNRFKIPSAQRKRYEKWSASDPVSFEECQRAKRIEKWQGNVNGILQKPCAKILGKKPTALIPAIRLKKRARPVDRLPAASKICSPGSKRSKGEFFFHCVSSPKGGHWQPIACILPDGLHLSPGQSLLRGSKRYSCTQTKKGMELRIQVR